MSVLAKVLSRCFRWLNFILDLYQTAQFLGGGGVGGVITAIIAWYSGLVWWQSAIFALLAGIVVVPILALIFKSFAQNRIEAKRLSQLPKLVYGIHNRITKVREKFEKEINWDKIDKNKVMQPIINATVEKLADKISNDSSMADKIEAVQKALDVMGGNQAISILDTYMNDSDTSLTQRLNKDFIYSFRTANLEQYKPYANRNIAQKVHTVLNSSMTYNNVALFQHYYPYKFLTFEAHTVVKGMGSDFQDAIDIACADLTSLIEQYISQGKARK